MMTADELNKRFVYHPPKNEDQVSRHKHVRFSGWEMARAIDSQCPESREKSLALTKIEEAIMWANAAIARNE